MTIEITLTSYEAGGDDVTQIVQDFDHLDEELGIIDEWVEEKELEHETMGFTEHYVDRYEY